MRSGTSPKGESIPPSTLKPNPAMSLITVTTSDCPNLVFATTGNISEFCKREFSLVICI